jgi:hypothetical protein
MNRANKIFPSTELVKINNLHISMQNQLSGKASSREGSNQTVFDDFIDDLNKALQERIPHQSEDSTASEAQTDKAKKQYISQLLNRVDRNILLQVFEATLTDETTYEKLKLDNDDAKSIKLSASKQIDTYIKENSSLKSEDLSAMTNTQKVMKALEIRLNAHMDKKEGEALIHNNMIEEEENNAISTVNRGINTEDTDTDKTTKGLLNEFEANLDNAIAMLHTKKILQDEVYNASRDSHLGKTKSKWYNPFYRGETTENIYQGSKLRSFFKTLVYGDTQRGFEAYWEVPAMETTAINGRWVKGPSFNFFEVLKKYFNDLPIIAEDLGVITTEVENLRDSFGFPGMKILQFAFGDNPQNPFLLHNHTYNSVVYTGTHDNSTTKGWYEDAKKNNKKIIKDLKNYHIINDKTFVWSIIEIVLSSVAKTAIIPMQDLLELDDSSRMNTPGTTEGNWLWRMNKLPNKTLSNKIYKSLIKFNRI